MIHADDMKKIRRIAGKYSGLCGRAYTLDDLVSEGCIGYMQAQERYNPNANDSLWGFAARRVKGAMIDFLRKGMFKGVEDQPHIEDYEDCLASDDVRFDQYEQYDMMRDAMKHLRPHQNRVIDCIYYKGMARRDVAREMRMTVESVKVVEQQALQSIKMRLLNA